MSEKPEETNLELQPVGENELSDAGNEKAVDSPNPSVEPKLSPIDGEKEEKQEHIPLNDDSLHLSGDLWTNLPIASTGYVFLTNSMLRKSQFILNALFFTVANAWLSAVTITTSEVDDEDETQLEKDTTALWVYAASITVVMFLIVYFLLFINRRYFTKYLKEWTSDEELVAKRITAQVWSRMVGLFSDSMIYIAAVALNSAIRESIPRSSVGWIWLYVLLLSIFSIGMVVFFKIIAIRIIARIFDSIATLEKEFSVEFFDERKNLLVQNDTLSKLSHFIVGALGWILALGFMEGIKAGAEEVVPPSERENVAFYWIFALGLIILVTIVISLISRHAFLSKKKKIGNSDQLLHLNMSVFVKEVFGQYQDFVSVALTFTAAIALDDAVDRSLRHHEHQAKPASLATYAILITITAVFVSMILEFVLARSEKLLRIKTGAQVTGRFYLDPPPTDPEVLVELFIYETYNHLYTLLSKGFALVVGNSWDRFISTSVRVWTDEESESIVGHWIYAILILMVAVICAFVMNYIQKRVMMKKEGK